MGPALDGCDSLNHPEAICHMNTGSQLGGDPAVGAWVTYGLGSENEDLPGYVVMTELAYPQGGATNWSNGFLPAEFQGMRLRPDGSPLLDLVSQASNPAHQRRALDELSFLHRTHLESLGGHDDRLTSRMESYELACRMQMEVPNVIDLAKETRQTLEMYGLNDPDTKTFGRHCLMARRVRRMNSDQRPSNASILFATSTSRCCTCWGLTTTSSPISMAAASSSSVNSAGK